MDSALKSAAVGRNSVVIAMVIGLLAQVLKAPIGDDEIKVLSDNIANMISIGNMVWAAIAAAVSRHRAKKAAQTAKEPPSLINNCGASLVYLLALLFSVACLCMILVGTYGCANNGQTVIEMPKESKMALARIAARRMGADMRQEFATVARQVVASYEAIDAAEGTAYQEGVFRIAKMVLEHEGVRDSDLLLADARDVLTIFGVQVPGALDLAWLQQFAPADIRAICEAFLEGADA